MRRGGTVKISISRHEVMHVRVLFFEVLQIIMTKTLVFIAHIKMTTNYPRVQQLLTWIRKKREQHVDSSTEIARSFMP